ncbi:MAG TPA: hypothetical protein EYP07_00170, partial [Kiloniellaceae bacterium]|nr:hypothetical protein [Kiloniellaceae bacterium]
MQQPEGGPGSGAGGLGIRGDRDRTDAALAVRPAAPRAPCGAGKPGVSGRPGRSPGRGLPGGGVALRCWPGYGRRRSLRRGGRQDPRPGRRHGGAGAAA